MFGQGYSMYHHVLPGETGRVAQRLLTIRVLPPTGTRENSRPCCQPSERDGPNPGLSLKV